MKALDSADLLRTVTGKLQVAVGSGAQGVPRRWGESGNNVGKQTRQRLVERGGRLADELATKRQNKQGRTLQTVIRRESTSHDILIHDLVRVWDAATQKHDARP